MDRFARPGKGTLPDGSAAAENKTNQIRKRLLIHYLVLCGILLCTGYLMFKNLGDAALWSDEAETALIAGNFLKTGHFTAWDGRNLAGHRNGSFLDKNLNNRNPPTQFLLTALSFSLFGRNNFTARLPFAILGFLTVFLLYITVRSELPACRGAALYASAYLGLLTEYILYVRNCRYYAITCFAALLCFFAYRRFLRQPTAKTSLWLAGSAVLLLYSQVLIGIGFLVPLAVVYMTSERSHLPKRHWVYLLYACLALALAMVPYLMLYHPWDRPDMPHGISLFQHLIILLLYLRDSMTSGIAPWLIVALALVLILRRSLEPDFIHLLRVSLGILAGQIIVIGCLSMQDISNAKIVTPLADVRYLVACYPFAAILAGGILYWVHKKNKPGALILALVLAGTTIACRYPLQDPRYSFRHAFIYSPLGDYWHEIHHHYATATSEVSSYLMERAAPDETFHAYPEFMNDPLKYYLGAHLVGCGDLDSNSHLGSEKIRTISPLLLKNDNFPDWIIFFGGLNYIPDIMKYFSRTISVKNDTSFNYEYEYNEEFHVYFEETNRPEIFRHHFGNVGNFNQAGSVFIFHKVKGDTAAWLDHLPQILLGETYLKDKESMYRELRKLFSTYLRHRALVTRHFSQDEIYFTLKKYRRILRDRNMIAEADTVAGVMLKLTPDAAR